MKNIQIAVTSAALALGVAMSGCGGMATSNNSNSSAKTTASPASGNTSSTAANTAANSAPAAKQGTPPKADMTMTAADLHKDYVALLAKNPKSLEDKYENKKIQISGTVSRVYPVTTGSGVETEVSFTGATSNNDDASCSVIPQTEESMALKPGDVITMVGTQTHNYNGSTPHLENCFVIKVGQ